MLRGVDAYFLSSQNVLPAFRDGFVFKYITPDEDLIKRYHRLQYITLRREGAPQQLIDYIMSDITKQKLMRYPLIIRHYRRPYTDAMGVYHPARVHLKVCRNPPFNRIPYLMERSRPQLPAAVAIGPITLSRPVICDYRSTNNHLRGIQKRVAHPVVYDGHLMQAFKMFVSNFVKRYEPLPEVKFSHENLDSLWLDQANYTLNEKAQYHKCLQTYLDFQGTTEDFTERYQDKLYLCNSFIKREFYGEFKEPRIINARPNLFKAIIAPVIKEIEHRVIYNDHFIKGKTPQWAAKRMQGIFDKFKFAYETDYSSFEGSFSHDVLNACEYVLFKHMLANNPIHFHILKKIYFNKSRLQLGTSGKMRMQASFDGSRMSGDLWTSLGNGFTNMMLFLFALKHSVNRHTLPHLDYDYMFEGDDGFFATTVPINTDIIRRLGFTLKLKTGTDVNHLSFCSICVGPGALPVLDFNRAIEKFGWDHHEQVIKDYSAKTTRYEKELMRSKAMSLLAVAPGNPIVQPLALKILELTEGVRVRDSTFTWWDWEKIRLLKTSLQPIEITQEMRLFYQARFNVSVKHQLFVEDIIKQQTSIRFVLPLTRIDVQ